MTHGLLIGRNPPSPAVVNRWRARCRSGCNTPAHRADVAVRGARSRPRTTSSADSTTHPDVRPRSPKRWAAGSSPAGGTAEVLVGGVRPLDRRVLRCKSRCNAEPSVRLASRLWQLLFDRDVPLVAQPPPSRSMSLGRVFVETSRARFWGCRACGPGVGHIRPILRRCGAGHFQVSRGLHAPERSICVRAEDLSTSADAPPRHDRNTQRPTKASDDATAATALDAQHSDTNATNRGL
jgi:hypothetical protein